MLNARIISHLPAWPEENIDSTCLVWNVIANRDLRAARASFQKHLSVFSHLNHRRLGIVQESAILSSVCGRYRLSRRKQIIEEHFDAAPLDVGWSPRYNIAPTQPVPLVRQHLRGERLLSAYRMFDGTRFWIITEADRSYTTLLLPEEY